MVLRQAREGCGRAASGAAQVNYCRGHSPRMYQGSPPAMHGRTLVQPMSSPPRYTCTCVDIDNPSGVVLTKNRTNVPPHYKGAHLVGTASGDPGGGGSAVTSAPTKIFWYSSKNNFSSRLKKSCIPNSLLLSNLKQ